MSSTVTSVESMADLIFISLFKTWKEPRLRKVRMLNVWRIFHKPCLFHYIGSCEYVQLIHLAHISTPECPHNPVVVILSSGVVLKCDAAFSWAIH